MFTKLKEKVTKWWTNLWDKFTTYLAKVLAWIVENKMLAIMIFTTVTKTVKYGAKIYSTKKEDEWRNRRFYDRRTDRWSYARKKLSKRQEAIIERRYQDGETYRSILDDMGLLK